MAVFIDSTCMPACINTYVYTETSAERTLRLYSFDMIYIVKKMYVVSDNQYMYDFDHLYMYDFDHLKPRTIFYNMYTYTICIHIHKPIYDNIYARMHMYI